MEPFARAGPPLPHGERYNQEELQKLKLKAETFVNKYYKRRQSNWFIRDKPPEYFTKIFTKYDGVMRPYIKDNHGDPKNPINKRIEGLFFDVSVNSATNAPHNTTIHGTRRLKIPAREMVHKAPKLYFSDFYCIGGRTHHVQLVLTKPRSEVDNFCEEHLVSLDVGSNPFFSTTESTEPLYKNGALEECPGIYRVPSGPGVWVEILFTEALDLSDIGPEGITPVVCIRDKQGQGGDHGQRKHSTCGVCNIKTESVVDTLANLHL